MLVHSRVYGLAERFDIPDLKQVVNDRFENTCSAVAWPPANFVDAALEVLRSTPANDKPLRCTLSRICADHFEDTYKTDLYGNSDISLEDWEAILTEDTDFTFSTMELLARKHCQELEKNKERKKLLTGFSDGIVCGDCGSKGLPIVHRPVGTDRLLVRCFSCGFEFDNID